jgi:hypothetical protein
VNPDAVLAIGALQLIDIVTERDDIPQMRQIKLAWTEHDRRFVSIRFRVNALAGAHVFDGAYPDISRDASHYTGSTNHADEYVWDDSYPVRHHVANNLDQ